MKVIFANNDTQSLNGADPLVYLQSMQPVEPTLIKKKELARRLSVSTATIDNWVSKRLIPYIQVTSRFYLYEFDAVLEALKKHYQVEPVTRD